MDNFGKLSATLITSYKSLTRQFHPRRVKVVLRNPRVLTVDVVELVQDLLTEKKVVVSVLKNVEGIQKHGLDYKAECYWRSEGKKTWPMSQGLGYRIIKHRIKSQRKIPTRLKRELINHPIPEFEIEWIITDYFGKEEYFKAFFDQKELHFMKTDFVYSKNFPDLVEVNFHHLRIARAGQPDFVWPLFNKDSPTEIIESQGLNSFFRNSNDAMLDENFPYRIWSFVDALEEHLHGMIQWMRYFNRPHRPSEEQNLVVNRISSLLQYLREILVIILDSDYSNQTSKLEELSAFDQLDSKIRLISSYESATNYSMFQQQMQETLKSIKSQLQANWTVIKPILASRSKEPDRCTMFGSFLLTGKCPPHVMSRLEHNHSAEQPTTPKDLGILHLGLLRTKRFWVRVDEDRRVIKFRLQRQSDQFLMEVDIIDGILQDRGTIKLQPVKDTDLVMLKDSSKKIKRFGLLNLAKARRACKQGLSSDMLVSGCWTVIPELQIPTMELDLNVISVVSVGALVSYYDESKQSHHLSFYPLKTTSLGCSSTWVKTNLKDWLPHPAADCRHQRFHADVNSGTLMANYNLALDSKHPPRPPYKDNIFLFACKLFQESNSLQLLTTLSFHVLGKVVHYDWFEHKKQMFHIVCFSDKMSQFFLKIHAVIYQLHTYHKQRFIPVGSSETRVFLFNKLESVYLLEEDDLVWGVYLRLAIKF